MSGLADTVRAERVEPFDRSHFADVRKPFHEASTPPSWFYTDRQIFEREIDRIFLDSWTFVGHESQFPLPGDYRTFVFFGHGVIVARDRSGSMRASAGRQAWSRRPASTRPTTASCRCAWRLGAG
ncbi:MAG: hypothetical protein RID91_02945 [Azospirillaceae bacterium]